MSTRRPSRAEHVIAVAVRGLAVLLPLVVAAGVHARGVLTFAGFFVVFGLLGLVEATLHVSRIGLHSQPGDLDPPLLAAFPLAQLRTYAVLHLACVPYVLVVVGRGSLSPLELLGAGLSLAAMGGSVGGLGGHDLFHRRSRLDRFLGVAVYATAGYGHFAAAHIGGHHVDTGRHADWGTARRGETMYRFLARALVDGFVGGLRIEAQRLRRRGAWVWTPANAVVRSVLVTLVVSLALVSAYGAATLAFFAAVSLLTVSLMELFNYISHYALTRDESPAPRALADVTWESNNKVVNWFIWNAGRHCHHHEKPAHGHEQLTLRHVRTAYIPHGIPLMALFAFVPPLYLSAMDRILVQTTRLSTSTAPERINGTSWRLFSPPPPSS
jgi:alkane 1-monooxygenase